MRRNRWSRLLTLVGSFAVLCAMLPFVPGVEAKNDLVGKPYQAQDNTGATAHRQDTNVVVDPALTAQDHNITTEQVSSTTTSALRTGMTWTVLGQQNGYVHVGTDSQTNVYSGDTTIDQALPILCLLVDYRAAPGDIPFNFYHGWARGAVQVTPPIRGTMLTSQWDGDTICASTFGSAWRMAEFHDGYYGMDFSASGGWAYWAAGQITPGTRFWAAINDQPANPWNSAGEVLPPSDDDVLKSHASGVMNPLLTLTQNHEFRNLVYRSVEQRFDGDDNVLLSDVMREAEQAQIVDTNSPAWQSLMEKVAQFQNVNGTAYDPQIYIPNFESGSLVRSFDVTMTVFEADLNTTELPAYALDASGNLQLKDNPIDETYAQTYEVWVVSVNERVDLTPAELATIRELDESGTTSRLSSTAAGTDSLTTLNVVCNPTGLRNNKGAEYLKQFRIPNPSSFEHWTAGKLEPRAIIVGKGGAEVGNKVFGKIKRDTVKNWYSTDLFLTTWDRALWGDALAYKWIEIDGGPKIELSLGLSAQITDKIKASGDVKATFEKKFDDMGSGVVSFTESTYIQYGTGGLDWTVCSVGGDGGTGNENLARSAITAASSTYPGYAAARVNDGSRDTSVGGASSWVNYAGTPNGWPPQWVQLDFGTNKTFSKVVVYTSSGYPIQDYDIQVWNGASWITIVTMRGNTASSVTHTFPSRTARLVRILGHKGPNIQPQYVRVNEFEVYP